MRHIRRYTRPKHHIQRYTTQMCTYKPPQEHACTHTRRRCAHTSRHSNMHAHTAKQIHHQESRACTHTRVHARSDAPYKVHCCWVSAGLSMAWPGWLGPCLAALAAQTRDTLSLLRLKVSRVSPLPNSAFRSSRLCLCHGWSGEHVRPQEATTRS